MKDWDAHIDATAALLGLTVTDGQRPGVRQFLGIAADMAAVLDEVPLDGDELALAPVFRPPVKDA